MIRPIPHLLSLALVERFESLAEELGVSEVARSKRGFLTAYKKAGGDWAALDPWWQNRRNNFVKRHMAQVELRQEPLFQEDGTPTRRHLGLIMWAHSPLTERQLEKTMRRRNPQPAIVFEIVVQGPNANALEIVHVTEPYFEGAPNPAYDAFKKSDVDRYWFKRNPSLDAESMEDANEQAKAIKERLEEETAFPVQIKYSPSAIAAQYFRSPSEHKEAMARYEEAVARSRSPSEYEEAAALPIKARPRKKDKLLAVCAAMSREELLAMAAELEGDTRENPPLEWHLQHEDPREVVRGLVRHHGQRAVLDEAFARQNPEWAKKLGGMMGRGEKATREGYRHYAPIVKERARQARKYLQESRRDLMDGYRAMRQNPDDEPRILKTYAIYTEESIEHGEAAEYGWADEEGVSCMPGEYDMEEGMTAVDLAVRHLENEGAIHASASHASFGVWYTTEPERDGDAIIEYSFHLRGFTPEEHVEIARRMGLR